MHIEGKEKTHTSVRASSLSSGALGRGALCVALLCLAGVAFVEAQEADDYYGLLGPSAHTATACILCSFEKIGL